MPLQDELCFVQFIHPGKEHRPDSDGLMDWNQREEHRRKFLEIDGRCLRNGREFKGPLRFWGEWEPQSKATRIETPVTNGPQFVQRPYFVVPPKYGRRQNTDPFVFEHFFYALCKQNTIKGPTQLRNLSQGSVVLFGSCVGGQFALDTVFVVDEWEDFQQKTAVDTLHNHVPKQYIDANVKTWNRPNKEKGGHSSCALASQQSFRLYSGATVDKPVRDMFSFFPCQPAEECENGFARPVITIPGRITENLQMGQKLNRDVTEPQIYELWKKVRKQVESAGLSLGVCAEMPKCRDQYQWRKK